MRWLLTTWRFGDQNNPDHAIREPNLPTGATMVANWAHQSDNQALVLVQGDTPIDTTGTDAVDITDQLVDDETFRQQLAPDFQIIPGWNPADLAAMVQEA